MGRKRLTKDRPDRADIYLGPRCLVMDKVSFMTRKDAKETKKVMKASGVHVENLAVFLCAYCGQFHLGKGTIKGKKGVPRSRHFGSGNPNQVDYKSERK